MKRFTSLSIDILAVAFALVALSGFGACSSNSPGSTTAKEVTFAEAVVTPEGGELVLADVDLHVPPGAVDSPVTLRVEKRSPAPGNPPRDVILGSIYEFFPQDFAFKTPATLTFKNAYRVVGCSVAWWNAPGGEWLPLASVSSEDYTSVSAPIEHFTFWGLERPSSDPLIPCGESRACDDALNFACVEGFCSCMPGMTDCLYSDEEGPSDELCVNLQDGTTRNDNKTVEGTDCGQCGHYCPKAALEGGQVDSQCHKGKCSVCTKNDTSACPNSCDICVDGQCQPGCTGCQTCFEGQCLPRCPSCETCDKSPSGEVCLPTKCGPCKKCLSDTCVSDCLPTEHCETAGASDTCVGDLCPPDQPGCGGKCCQAGQTCVGTSCCSPCDPGWISCAVPIEGNPQNSCGFACCNPAEPVCCPGVTPWIPRCCKKCGDNGGCAG